MHVEELASLWDLAFTLDPAGHPEVIEEIEDDFVHSRQEEIPGGTIPGTS
jgi:hypothetical protein